MSVKNIFSNSEDFLRIEGLEISSHVGVTEEERALLQDLNVSITLWTSLEQAGHSDQIRDTVDYAKVMDETRKLLQGKTFNLIEAMAEKTSQLILNRFEVEKIQVSVSKLSLPGVQSVTATVLRTKKSNEKSIHQPKKTKHQN